MIEYRRRLNLAKNNGQMANCIGTAFYLAGYIDEDRHIEPREIDDDFLVRLADYRIHCIAALFHADTGEWIHAGIVTGIVPLCVTHRAGIKGRIIEDDSWANFVGTSLRVPRFTGFFGRSSAVK